MIFGVDGLRPFNLVLGDFDNLAIFYCDVADGIEARLRVHYPAIEDDKVIFICAQ